MSILEDKDKEIKNLRQTNLMKKILLITHTVGSIKQEKTKGVPYKITSWNTVHDVVKQKLLEQEVLIIPFIKEHTKEHIRKGKVLVVIDLSFEGFCIDSSDKYSRTEMGGYPHLAEVVH